MFIIIMLSNSLYSSNGHLLHSSLGEPHCQCYQMQQHSVAASTPVQQNNKLQCFIQYIFITAHQWCLTMSDFHYKYIFIDHHGGTMITHQHFIGLNSIKISMMGIIHMVIKFSTLIRLHKTKRGECRTHTLVLEYCIKQLNLHIVVSQYFLCLINTSHAS